MPYWYGLVPPPMSRGRKREARQWLEVLTARITNGLPRERRLGQPHVMPSEGFRIFEAALAALELRDPTLSAAVAEVMWDDSVAEPLSPAELRTRAVRSARRIAKVRATLPVSLLGNGTGLY